MSELLHASVLLLLFTTAYFDTIEEHVVARVCSSDFGINKAIGAQLLVRDELVGAPNVCQMMMVVEAPHTVAACRLKLVRAAHFAC